jgi:hypothetical protein
MPPMQPFADRPTARVPQPRGLAPHTALPPRPGSAERQFLDAAERAARFPRGRLALALHLSRLRPPGPRPHHRRVALALLRDTAERNEGQVFALGNADLVLLCRRNAEIRRVGRTATPPDPLALPGLLGRLLRLDAPDSAALVSLWPLPSAAAALLDYARERLTDGTVAPPAPEDGTMGSAGLNALVAAAHAAPLAALLRQQVAAELCVPDNGVGAPLRPLWREITFSLPALAAHAGVPDQARADPFLLCHLAGAIDPRLLRALSEAIGRGGPLDPLGPPGAAPGLPLHLKLSLETVLSGDFTRLVMACRARGQRLGVAVSFMEAAAAGDTFVEACAAAASAGWSLGLDDVSHLALLLAQPGEFGTAQIRLAWSPAMAALPDEETRGLAAALRAIGPERVVLTHADEAAALRWGATRGIRRFQGHHIDAVLAAVHAASAAA